MSEDIKEVEKIENEIELSVKEREKLKEFLKENLEIIIKAEENKDKDNENKILLKKIEGIKFYEKLKVFCEIDIKSGTSDTKYPKRLAFKHSYLDKKVDLQSTFAPKNNPSLENSIYPVFYLYTTEDDKRKYIILTFGYWADPKKKSPISWDKRLSQSFFSIGDYFINKKECDIKECFKKNVGNNLPTHKEAVLYSAYLIENNLEEQINKITYDLERILKYYILYIELYEKYKEKIANYDENDRKDKNLKEILEDYMKCTQDLSQEEKKECEEDEKNYDKIFINFINGGFYFPLNTILYGNSEIAKNYVIYSVGIIEKNKIISKESSKKNIDIAAYKEITSFNDYKNILEKFETYKENGQIEFISSNAQNTSDNFKNICEKVKNDKYNNNYILIIENINKRDKLEIFGEDYSELEKRLFNKEDSKIPKNLYILGTINTFANSKAFLNVEFFNNFNFEKMYSKDQIIEKIGKIDEEIIENGDNFKFPLNTILYGPPGTGKTYNSIFYSVGIIKKDKSIIDMIEDKTKNISNIEKEEIFNNFNIFNDLKKQGQIEFITFHQSYSYEDFVEGIRPTLTIKDNEIKANSEDKKDLKYTIHSGIFKNICERAKNNQDKNYVLIIDEINRGNISKIFGELITLLEPTKRLGEFEELKIRLPYSGEEFGVPKNLYILGTMNTADRSIALLDIALRRRFNFIEMPPKYNLLNSINIETIGTESKNTENTEIIDLKKLLEAINTRIEFLLDKDHLIGHSYFINIKSFEDLKEIFRNSIIPLLQEYFYDDFEKIKFVLNGEKSNFIVKKVESNSNYVSEDMKKGFSKSLQNKIVYEIDKEAFEKDENYINIYTLETENNKKKSEKVEPHDN